MILTIEPGLYFGAWRPDLDIDEKWAGIGIRIEDDVLITEKGYEVLTSDCPKKIDEIEKIIGISINNRLKYFLIMIILLLLQCMKELEWV